jgi:hypothetical protein
MSGSSEELIAVQAYFLHERLLLDLLPSPEQRHLEADIERRSTVLPRGAAVSGALERLVAHVLSSRRATELTLAYVAEDVRPGSLVTATQNFYVKNIGGGRARIRGQLDVDRAVEIVGEFSLSRTVGETGRSEIFGQHRYTVLAYLQSDDVIDGTRTLRVRPLFVGWRLHRPQGALPYSPDGRPEVWPSSIDQFTRADLVKRPLVGEVRAMRSLPEEAVKNAFSDIIGEPYVGKDWGGEASDLYTARLTISGVPLTAAFAFKGPGKPGPLYISSMGKRGDQAIRLAGEPADLLVVQHHDKIEPAVRHLMTALARDRGKRFMIIDGQATTQILKAYNKLPAVGPAEAGSAHSS